VHHGLGRSVGHDRGVTVRPLDGIALGMDGRCHELFLGALSPVQETTSNSTSARQASRSIHRQR
jgi:hypothetical protein